MGAALLLVASPWLYACDSGASPEEPSGPTRHTAPNPCGSPELFPAQGTAGRRVGNDFQPFAGGEPVQLQYGSQAGMGLGVAFELNDLELAEVDRIEVDLVVDQHSLGVFTDERPTLSCQNGFSYFEAMVMLDVLAHPTVASVAQLDKRDAVIELSVLSETDILISEAFHVELQL